MRGLALLAAVGVLFGFAVVVVGTAAGTAGEPAVVAENDTEDEPAATMYRTADLEITDLESPAEIEREIADGSIENESAMLWTETLVVAIEDERLPAPEPADGDERTEAFFAALEDDGTDLWLYQTNPTPGTGLTEVPLGPENATVYPDGGVTYVVEPGFPVEDEQHVWDREQFGIAYGAVHEPYPTDEPMQFHVSKAEVRHLSDGDPLPTETVQRDVDLNVPTDEGVDVSLELRDEIRTATVGSAQDDEFDLSDLESGTKYELELRHDGTTVETYSGSVEDPSGELEVIDVGETTVDGVPTRNLTLDVTLSHGGTVRVTDALGEEDHDIERLAPERIGR